MIPRDAAAEFSRLADHFAAARTPRAIRQFSAWGAQLCRQAADAGLLELPQGVPWPKPTQGETAREFAYAAVWAMLVLTWRDGPPNPLGLRRIDGVEGVEVSMSDAESVGLQAICTYAEFARHLAALAGATEADTTDLREYRCTCGELLTTGHIGGGDCFDIPQTTLTRLHRQGMLSRIDNPQGRGHVYRLAEVAEAQRARTQRRE